MHNEKVLAEIKSVLDDCQLKVSSLVGKPVAVSFRLKVQGCTIERLAEIICATCQISWTAVLQQNRRADAVLARHLFCYFATTYLKKPVVFVASLIQKDHTTVIHGRDKVKAMIDVMDDLYYSYVVELEDKIRKEDDMEATTSYKKLDEILAVK